MLDLHTTSHGFREVWIPFLVRRESMFGTGQLPKLEEDMYQLADDDLFLIPTAEVPITNLYRDEVLEAERPPDAAGRLLPLLPARGGDVRQGDARARARAPVRQGGDGQDRRPETSYDELESLVRDAEEVLQTLELPYRVLSLCTGDLSFAAAKCYDLEAWAPAEERWLEVSSCSNFESFQARRIGLRFRNAQGKLEYLHTLNGSGLALPRIVAACWRCTRPRRERSGCRRRFGPTWEGWRSCETLDSAVPARLFKEEEARRSWACPVRTFPVCCGPISSSAGSSWSAGCGLYHHLIHRVNDQSHALSELFARFCAVTTLQAIENPELAEVFERVIQPAISRWS